MKPNHETIYLVPTDYDGGQLTYSWCDCPAPGEGMDPEDATRYVREDIYLALQAQVEQLQFNLNSKTDIANQLKDNLTDAFGREMKLKAKVGQLREFALHVNSSCADYFLDGERIDFEKLGCYASDVYKATPEQCLSEVKAQAVYEILSHFGNKFRANEKLTVKNVCWMLNEHLKQLRQQAKGE